MYESPVKKNVLLIKTNKLIRDIKKCIHHTNNNEKLNHFLLFHKVSEPNLPLETNHGQALNMLGIAAKGT